MFWKRKPVEEPKKRTKGKKQPKTVRQMLSESFHKELSKNPELMSQAAIRVGSQELGVELVPKTEGERKREEVDRKITEAALQTIEDDPDLKGELARQRANEILGLKPTRRPLKESDSDEDYEFESPLAKAIHELQELRTLEGELGGANNKSENSWMSLLKDPEVIKAIFGFLASGMAQGQRPPPVVSAVPSRTYIVQVEGESREVSEQEYRQLTQSNMVKPIALIEAKKPEVKAEEKTSDEVMIVSRSAPAKPESVKETPSSEKTEEPQDELMSYLELSPEEFVAKMYELAAKGDERALFLKKLLKDCSYDTIRLMISPYANNPQYKKYIDKILNNKEWVEEVIALAFEAENELLESNPQVS